MVSVGFLILRKLRRVSEGKEWEGEGKEWE